jgi:uncharacterized protein (TIGR03000 family)
MRRKGILLAGVVALGISLVVPSVCRAGPFGFFDGRSYSTSADTPSPAPTFAKDRAYLTIQLPVDKAEIWIEGVKSVQDKRSQEYVSPTIEPGKKYFYEVRARWTDAKGKAVEMKRTFPIFAGTPVMVDFTKTQAPSLAADVKPLDGMVVKAGDGKITLSFKAEKETKTYDVAKDAKIMLDGKDCKLGDLKANFFVKVFCDDKFVVTKIDGKSKEK